MAPLGGPVDLNLGTLLNVINLYASSENLSDEEKVQVFELVHFAYYVYLVETYPDQIKGGLPEEDEDLED